MRTSNKAFSKPLNVGVALQGGGSLGAFSAGVLTQILDDPQINIRVLTGTSAGAMNGMIVAQTLNQYGHTVEGRKEASTRLFDFWQGVINPYAALTQPYDDLCNIIPFFRQSASPAASYILTNHIQKFIKNPEALISSEHTSLFINAVDNSGQERLFTGGGITHDSTRASAALRPYFQSVYIDGKSYSDGAYLGGSNPPVSPLLNNGRELDALIFIMTNPPQSPIQAKDQKDIQASDVASTSGLILHQAYDHIALLLKQQENGGHAPVIPPVHLFYPQINRAFSPKEKQNLSREFIESLFSHGQTYAARSLSNNRENLGVSSTITFSSLQRLADHLQKSAVNVNPSLVAHA